MLHLSLHLRAEMYKMKRAALLLSICFLLSLKREDWSTTHYAGDTLANFSRLIANLSWLIPKLAGN
jgi:hypothetical protein